MRKKLFIGLAAGAGTVLLAATPAAAIDIDLEAPHVFTDNAFILICGALVVFMQAGFAMVEAGLTRAKNAAHMMLKNLLDFVIASTAFALIGYHIAYSGAAYFGFNWQWGGPLEAANGAAILGVDNGHSLTVPIHFFFNMAFAAAAATICSGAMAERVKFQAYFIYALVISAFVYPLMVSWVWNTGGWLADQGFVDFAGGSVVHGTGGMAALMGAKILGPRIGRFDDDGTSNPIPGHNIPLAILGVFILLVGWFGFNPGSFLQADVQIGTIAAVTAVGAGAGALGATVSSWLTIKTPDVTLIGNGLLGGLVAITAGALNLSILGAMVVGLVGGVIATYGVLGLDKFRIDDPVGAIPVHLMAGTWGTLALGLFADPDAIVGGGGPAGFLYGGDFSLLGTQLLGASAILGFTGVVMGSLFMVLRETGKLRVSAEEEFLGMDLAEHATPAYNDDAVALNDDFGDADFDAAWLDEVGIS